MKKTIRTILCVAAFAVLAVSCQKEMEINEVEPNTKETIEISVNGLMGEYTQVDAAKASLVNNVRVSWEGGETVFVFDGTECLGSLVASLDGTEDRYALLSTDTGHTVKAPATGTTKLTLVYSPLLTEAPAVSEGAISISLANQNGTKAPFVAYATLDYTGTNISNAIVPFKFATSVIKVNCSGLKASTAITSVTLSNVNTVCNLTLSGDKAPVVAGGTNGTITRTGDIYFAASKVNAEGEAVFQIAVPALETASGARVLTVEQDSDKIQDKKFTTNSLDPATSVNTVCQFVRPPVGALPGLFTIGNNPYEYRQIYFSQGNLFSDQSTFYFEENQYDFRGSWDVDHRSHFYWSEDYAKAFAQDYNDPYASISDIFFANASDFVVSQQWLPIVRDMPTGWYTLSKMAWFNLFDNTERMVYGKPCYSNAMSGVRIEGQLYYGIFLYPDDYDGDIVSDDSMTWNDINAAGIVFLPAAGKRNGSDVSDIGSICYYWTSSLEDDIFGNSYAIGLYFDSDNFDIKGYNRNVGGYAVRLVKNLK